MNKFTLTRYRYVDQCGHMALKNCIGYDSVWLATVFILFANYVRLLRIASMKMILGFIERWQMFPLVQEAILFIKFFRLNTPVSASYPIFLICIFKSFQVHLMFLKTAGATSSLLDRR